MLQKMTMWMKNLKLVFMAKDNIIVSSPFCGLPMNMKYVSVLFLKPFYFH